MVDVEEVEGVQIVQAQRTLLKMIDIAGREIKTPSNQLVFLLFDDGSSEKRFFGERQ